MKGQQAGNPKTVTVGQASAPKQGQRSEVSMLTVSEHQVEQRLDNFLIGRLKGVPKSLVYRIIRKGEVRVNGKRAKAETRLEEGDQVRVPPLRLAEAGQQVPPSAQLSQHLRAAILLDDPHFMVLNKPSGLPVHSGTGVKLGLIEALRQLFPELPALELVHRLDKGTSGCLLLAKTGKARKWLTQAFRDHAVEKTYHAIVEGNWPRQVKQVDAALLRQPERGGERRVEIDEEGKAASTKFGIAQNLLGATLVQAKPLTGRTHQIRVHAAWVGCPLLGDDKYASSEQTALQKRAGNRRLFLHAAELKFPHPEHGRPVLVQAPYDAAFAQAVRSLSARAVAVD